MKRPTPKARKADWIAYADHLEQLVAAPDGGALPSDPDELLAALAHHREAVSEIKRKLRTAPLRRPIPNPPR